MKSLIFFILIAVSLKAFGARSEVDRFALMQDKFFLETLFRPIGHEYYFDTSVEMTTNTLDFIDNAEEKASTRDANEIQNFLNENLETEHQAFVRVATGAPLPSFSLWGTDIDPSIRFKVDGGISASLGEPSQLGITNFTNALVQLYAKLEGDIGLRFDMEHTDHFYSHLDVYWNQMRDHFSQQDGVTLANDTDSLDITKAVDNSVVSLRTDYSLGYRNKSFDIMVAIEDLMVAELNDKKSEAVGRPIFGSNKPLTRLHMSYNLEFDFIDLKPFVGAYNRSHYSLSDTMYGGTEVFFGAFPLSAYALMDPDHFTFSPRLRIWVLNLEYLLKFPVGSKDDSFNTETLHALNVRVAF